MSYFCLKKNKPGQFPFSCCCVCVLCSCRPCGRPTVRSRNRTKSLYIMFRNPESGRRGLDRICLSYHTRGSLYRVKMLKYVHSVTIVVRSHSLVYLRNVKTCEKSVLDTECVSCFSVTSVRNIFAEILSEVRSRFAQKLI